MDGRMKKEAPAPRPSSDSVWESHYRMPFAAAAAEAAKKAAAAAAAGKGASA